MPFAVLQPSRLLFAEAAMIVVQMQFAVLQPSGLFFAEVAMIVALGFLSEHVHWAGDALHVIFMNAIDVLLFLISEADCSIFRPYLWGILLYFSLV
jgi:hypothetical protein